jgi:hypothetical protein
MHVLATADCSLTELWDEAMRLGRAGEVATFDLTSLPEAEQGPAAGAVAEAASLGAYRFGAPERTAAPVEIRASVALDVPLRRAEIVAAPTNLARALVAAPPSALTPAAFAERARERARMVGAHPRSRGTAERSLRRDRRAFPRGRSSRCSSNGRFRRPLRDDGDGSGRCRGPPLRAGAAYARRSAAPPELFPADAVRSTGRRREVRTDRTFGSSGRQVQ